MTEWASVAPDLESFVGHFAKAKKKAKAVRELYAVITSVDPSGELEERIVWLERVSRWLHAGGLPDLAAPTGIDEPLASARLRLLLTVLEEVDTWRESVRELVSSVLQQSSAFYMLSRLGLPGDRSFLDETMDRLSRRVLPAPRDDKNLAQLLERLFPTEGQAAWLRGLDPNLALRFVNVVDDGKTWRPLAREAADAALLIATRMSALGLSEDIRERSPRVPLRESPLFQLPRACDALLAELEGQGDEQIEAFQQVRSLFVECRYTIERVVHNLERFGVSVDVVYRLEVMSKNMTRLESLLDQLMPGERQARVASTVALLGKLASDHLRDRSILDLVRANMHLLARKIIERAGYTGEHYITATRAEYRGMMLSAAGGGVLTSLTASIKFVTSSSTLPLFVDGMLAGSNYALSFVVMQLLGFTLATKQPSMTAAALAATLRERQGQESAHQLDELVTVIARITRSQLAAVAGNLGLVIPASFAIDYLVRVNTGAPFLTAEKASYVLHSLHPLASGTVFYAAVTGVVLWSSSIVAGWVENWAVYRRLPEAIAQHRLGRYIGQGRMLKLSELFSKHIAGLGGNIALGFLLGMTPVIGRFFGLPIDVRHITLSTSSLTFAACALGPIDALQEGAAAAMLGIGVIGLLNFGVSFALALLIALRAREVAGTQQRSLVRAVLARLRSAPREFFLPPKMDPPQALLIKSAEH
jgi:site-specific recombinase